MLSFLRTFVSRVLVTLTCSETFFSMIVSCLFGAWIQYADNPYWWLWLSSAALFVALQDSFTWKMNFSDNSILMLFVLVIATVYYAPYMLLLWFVLGVVRRFWFRRHLTTRNRRKLKEKL